MPFFFAVEIRDFPSEQASVQLTDSEVLRLYESP
jgi:hypothetical protein